MNNKKNIINTTQHSAETKKYKIGKLKELKSVLEKELEENKKKRIIEFNKRNIKFVYHTFKFLLPYLLSTGLTVGGFNLIGKGLPFHLDQINKYKVYNLDYDTMGYVTMDEEYIDLHKENVPSSSLVIYSPWEEQDGQ
jgi:hypothetical protein